MRRAWTLATVLFAAIALAFPAHAVAPVAPQLRFWQAKRVARAHGREQLRPDFRVESMRRLARSRVRVCWSEPGYLGPLDGRDYGCDVVERRRGQWWIRDDSVMSGIWVRWL